MFTGVAHSAANVPAGPAKAGPLAAEPYITYTVKPSDTLQGLTRSLLVKPAQWPQVAQLNSLKNPNLIQPGQAINIPKSLLRLESQPALATPGKIVSVQGDVTVSGKPVQVGAAVPEGAQIQTGPNSSVVVQMGDNSRVQLMPKSLLEVTRQRGYALRDPASSAATTWYSGAMRLAQGVLEVLAAKNAQRISPMEVSTPTSLVGVRGTEFRVAYEDPASGVARTEVLEGKVATDNTAQKTSADIGGGFGAALNPKVRDIQVVALLPALADAQLPAQILRGAAAGAANSAASATATPAAANWTVGRLSGAAGYRAQFAADKDFAQIQGDFKSASPTLDVASLPDGSYYARVRGIDPAGIEGFNAVKRVQIQANLVWPGEVAIGATAEYVPDGLLLKVYGKSTDLPRQLNVQIASDAAFTQNLQSAVATTSLGADASVILRNVPVGQRSYLRFSGTSPQGTPGSSAVFTLDVPGNWGFTVLTLSSALQPVR